MLLGTKNCVLYWRNYVKSGCAIAGFHCISFQIDWFRTNGQADGQTGTHIRSLGKALSSVALFMRRHRQSLPSERNGSACLRVHYHNELARSKRNCAVKSPSTCHCMNLLPMSAFGDACIELFWLCSFFNGLNYCVCHHCCNDDVDNWCWWFFSLIEHDFSCFWCKNTEFCW